MKKTLMFMAAAMVMACGCSKLGKDDSTVAKFTVKAGISQSKTALGNVSGTSQEVLWQAGDAISVNGQTSEALAQGGSASATFEFTQPVTGELYGAYPASAVNNFSEGSAVITLPATQTWTEGNYDSAAAVLLGTGSEGEITLTHAMAYLKVTPVKGSEDVMVKSIELNSFGGVLCGDFDTDFATLTPAEGNTGYRVSMTPAEPVALGTSFIFAIPAHTYNGKLEMTIEDNAGNYMKVTSNFNETTPFVAEAGHMYPTTVTYVHHEDKPQDLYMLGDGTPGGWSSTTKIEGNGSGVYTIEGVNLSGGNFKIYPDDPYQSGNWAPYYGATEAAVAGNIAIEKVMSTSATERNFNIERWGYTTGIYNVTVDLNNMVLTLEKLNLRNAYLYGACFTGKPDWDYWAPLTETGNNTNIYSGVVDLITTEDWRGFKIYPAIGDWDNEYCCDWGKSIGGDPDNIYFDHKSTTGDAQIYPYSFGITNGKNIVTVNFNTKKVTFTAVN